MAYSEIIYEVTDRIATITMNRPDKLNAFTVTMLQEMVAAFDEIDADDDVRAVIVTGAGRGFCAGADLSAGAASFDYEASDDAGANDAAKKEKAAPASIGLSDEMDERLRDGGGLLTLRIYECTKPVIAAINGPAVGVGATMTLPMDIRLAADSAKMGFVFARRGLVPEAASSWFLPKVVGLQTALEWTFTGRVFPVADAHEAGLVRSVHPGDELLDAARAIATEIAENTSAVSVAATRQMLWRMAAADHPMQAHKVDSRMIHQLGTGADVAEGVTSFLEKRAADFSMKPSEDMPPVFPWWDDPEFS